MGGTSAKFCVIEGGQPGPTAMLELLTALTEKSLVLARGDGAPRYRMLEVVRHFGLERLEAEDDRAAIERRHADAGREEHFVLLQLEGASLTLPV